MSRTSVPVPYLEVLAASADFRLREKSGSHLLGLRLTGFDPDETLTNR